MRCCWSRRLIVLAVFSFCVYLLLFHSTGFCCSVGRGTLGAPLLTQAADADLQRETGIAPFRAAAADAADAAAGISYGAPSIPIARRPCPGAGSTICVMWKCACRARSRRDRCRFGAFIARPRFTEPLRARDLSVSRSFWQRAALKRAPGPRWRNRGTTFLKVLHDCAFFKRTIRLCAARFYCRGRCDPGNPGPKSESRQPKRKKTNDVDEERQDNELFASRRRSPVRALAVIFPRSPRSPILRSQHARFLSS